VPPAFGKRPHRGHIHGDPIGAAFALKIGADHNAIGKHVETLMARMNIGRRSHDVLPYLGPGLFASHLCAYAPLPAISHVVGVAAELVAARLELSFLPMAFPGLC
jgi:hypothetical protein